MSFETLDSGKREKYDSGMVRDTQEGKARYDLLDRDFLRRWAELMARGAEKYGEENWRLACSEVELRRFKASATRHLFQWLGGATDEDHAVAVTFNLAAAEYVKRKLDEAEQPLTIPYSNVEQCMVCGKVNDLGTIWYTQYSGDKPIECNHGGII